ASPSGWSLLGSAWLAGCCSVAALASSATAELQIASVQRPHATSVVTWESDRRHWVEIMVVSFAKVKTFGNYWTCRVQVSSATLFGLRGLGLFRSFRRLAIVGGTFRGNHRSDGRGGGTVRRNGSWLAT